MPGAEGLKQQRICETQSCISWASEEREELGEKEKEQKEEPEAEKEKEKETADEREDEPRAGREGARKGG